MMLYSAPEWQDAGACRDQPGDWVDVPRVGVVRLREIKRLELELCRSCPVTGECLDHALAAREVNGIWGGKLPQERRRLEKA